MRQYWYFGIVLIITAPAAAQDMPLSQILIDGEGWRPAGLQDMPVLAHLPVKTREGASYFGKAGAIVLAWDGNELSVADGVFVVGLALSPDGGTLVAADGENKHLWAFRVEANGHLTCKERYYTLRTPPGKTTVRTKGLTVDRAGRVYAATELGIQVFDPTGRLCGVLLKPAEAPLTGVAFGGPERDTLYTFCGNQVYGRKLNTKGVPPPAKP